MKYVCGFYVCGFAVVYFIGGERGKQVSTFKAEIGTYACIYMGASTEIRVWGVRNEGSKGFVAVPLIHATDLVVRGSPRSG